MSTTAERMDELGLELIVREDAAIHPDLVTMATVEPVAVRWLWPGYIPRGKLTILDGDPGLGKSTLLLDLAARLSVGGSTPTGDPLPVGHTLVITSEDAPADTIRPRLDAAGADPLMVHYLPTIDLPAEVDRLADILGRVDARLVIFDPLVSVLDDSVRTNNNKAVRRALAPLVLMLERLDCAGVALRHLTKPQGSAKPTNAIYRGQDSIAFGGAVRSNIAVGRDPEDAERFVLASVKLNIGRTPPSLAYRLVADGPYDPARVEWEGETHLSAEQLIGNASEGAAEQGRVGHLAATLREIVSNNGGTILARDGYRALEAEGIGTDSEADRSNLSRARRKAGIGTRKAAFDQGWEWHLE